MSEEKPIAWYNADDSSLSFKNHGGGWQPLYTTPQTKPLSDEEIAVIWANFGVPMTGIEFMKVARAIEQKVKGQ